MHIHRNITNYFHLMFIMLSVGSEILVDFFFLYLFYLQVYFQMSPFQ